MQVKHILYKGSVELMSHTEDGDLLVVNAARCSFDKEHESYDPDKDMSLNFPPTPAVNAENWLQTLHQLKESIVRLSEKIESYADEKVLEKVPIRTYDFYKLMHGIVQHDLYHAGQLILLKKMLL